MGGERGGMKKPLPMVGRGPGLLRPGEPGLVNKVQAALASGSSLFFW